MNKNNCTAYIGNFFTIEWYYDEKGKSQSHEYYEGLSDLQKRKLLVLFKRIGDFGKIHDITKFNFEGVEAVVDNKSMLFLEGTTLDFYEDINKRGFVFNNPNATKSCGCGQSFSA